MMAASRSLAHPGPCLVLAALVSLFPAVANRYAAEEDMSDEHNEQPPGYKDPITDYMVRRCVEARASDWLKLHERLGLPEPQGPEPFSVSELVDRRMQLMDARDFRKSSRGKLASFVHGDWSSSSVQAWKKDKAEIDKNLSAWGFSYHAALHRCQLGANDESYECMKESIPRCWNCPFDLELLNSVKLRLDLKDLLAHPGSKTEKKDLKARVKVVDNIFKEKYYNWKESKNKCQQDMLNERKEIELRIKSELSAGEKNDKDGVCAEKPNKMCPEGTYVTTKRRRDAIKGATAATTTYIFGKLVMTPLGVLAGTAVAGPGGGVPGALMAGSVASWLVAAAGYWGSLGPKECACFMRDCAFDEEQGSCRMVNNDESPSKNPFATKLPMAGTKCDLKYKSKNECAVTQCGIEDFKPAIGSDLFGIVGNTTTGVYNCLSKTGSQSGALTLEAHLPRGKVNNIEERIKLFSELAPLEASQTDDEPADDEWF